MTKLSASRRAVLCLHVVHLKSFNARLAVDYPLPIALIWIDMAILTTCCFGKGRGSTETQYKLFANHNALGQLTNHNTFRFSEGGPSSNPELIEHLCKAGEKGIVIM